jgi:ubiquitin-conjugating enzyme E2 N
VRPDPNNFKHFFVKIDGPGNTPYENGLFDAELLLPEDYPMVIA